MLTLLYLLMYVVMAALALQAPLQPLQDNLESQTYETFEKDVTKYNCYQEAVRRALLDRVPAEAADSTVTVLMVVGAGGWGGGPAGCTWVAVSCVRSHGYYIIITTLPVPLLFD